MKQNCALPNAENVKKYFCLIAKNCKSLFYTAGTGATRTQNTH